MVKQGQIIKVNFDPKKGHEQAGYRPALVVSNDTFIKKTNLAIVCPITNTNNKFPLHISLDSNLKTEGVVLCEHIISLDLDARGYTIVEEVTPAFLEKVLTILKAEIDTE